MRCPSLCSSQCARFFSDLSFFLFHSESNYRNFRFVYAHGKYQLFFPSFFPPHALDKRAPFFFLSRDGRSLHQRKRRIEAIFPLSPSFWMYGRTILPFFFPFEFCHRNALPFLLDLYLGPTRKVFLFLLFSPGTNTGASLFPLLFSPFPQALKRPLSLIFWNPVSFSRRVLRGTKFLPFPLTLREMNFSQVLLWGNHGALFFFSLFLRFASAVGVPRFPFAPSRTKGYFVSHLSSPQAQGASIHSTLFFSGAFAEIVLPSFPCASSST